MGRGFREMSKKKVMLFLSCVSILVCACIFVGVTYALFSDKVEVKNHLQAADFDVELWRRNFVYTELDDDGRLVRRTVTEDKNFTDPTPVGIFGEAIDDLKVLPGSYFEAELEVVNNGDVAFDYGVTLELVGASNELAEQIRVTVTYADSSTVQFLLSDCEDDDPSVAGNANAFKIFDIEHSNMTAAAGQSETFTIKLEFLNHVDNNLAKNQEVSFDIIVEAVQEEVTV